ncbi:MAG TPA: 1-phosphofructokinase [Candidatus Eisenbergiella merdipullorum]|uniref:Tagatose-6-phosphate kinase n=1 Tax=Candidatus Eisenbergiella merdipullorum TaxID=2838553 RepID=A0A9D2L2A5_9FIRM|nr:1-phosphofructokinase [Candidatus Eisenbergiella merdipullorum]
MILTVTLNPAVDKTYRTGELFCGRVNRMRSVTNIPGGKGINVSKILRQYGCEVTAAGFLGGFPGEWMEKELLGTGMICEFVKIGQETRSSMNIVADNGYVTEILEPGPQITKEEMLAFLGRFEELVSSCSIVVLSGSVPQGIPEDIYASLIRMAAAQGKETVLDTSGELLRKGIEAVPTVIKPNRKELEYVIGHRLTDRADLLEAAALLRRNGVRMAAVSLGNRGLLLAGEEGSFYAKPPRVKTVNTVGCGDSVVASLVMSRLARMGEEEMLRRAVALSAASASSFESGSIPKELAEKLYDEVYVERL